MSWSKVRIALGLTGDNEAFSTDLFSLGVINDKSTSLSAEDGDVLEAVATGGVVVATEESEPTITLTTRIKEMGLDIESKLIKGTLSSNGDSLVVTSNIIDGDYSVLVVPKNTGAIGLKIRRAHVSFRPGYSEEEGQYTDVTFKVLACSDGELYTKFRVTDDDVTAANELYYAGGGA